MWQAKCLFDIHVVYSNAGYSIPLKYMKESHFLVEGTHAGSVCPKEQALPCLSEVSAVQAPKQNGNEPVAAISVQSHERSQSQTAYQLEDRVFL